MGQLRRIARRARRANRSVVRRARAGRSAVRLAVRDARDELVTWRARRVLDKIRRDGTDLAVVVHLFHPEVWPDVAARLERLSDTDVDVFVTLPARDRAVIASVLESCPGATCLVVPNRGRDVFPYLVVADRLAELGYAAALKLHSKKSEHFSGGNRWRDGMFDELVPVDPDVKRTLLARLREPGTGIVGPHSIYFPLSTYWAGNAALVEQLIRPHVSAEQAARLAEPRTLGFFAGTMFWARLDAIKPLLRVRPTDFPPEPTPKDGTLAHALERALPVLPELLGRTQYDSDATRIAPRPAEADPIPDWYRDATRAAVAAEKARAKQRQ